MEKLSESENSMGNNVQSFAFHDSGSTRQTQKSKWSSGKKKLLATVGCAILLVFTIWLIVIQKENQSLRDDLKDMKKMVRNLQDMGRMTFVQDCTHLRSHGVTQSGKYFVDPDGSASKPFYHEHNRQNNRPLEVFCDFEKNYTIIPYDRHQDETQVMKLISKSRGSCWQDLTFDCKAVNYSFNGIPKAWWLDRNGAKQYFFNGAFENTTNLDCQNCKCVGNHGRIKSEWLLPITGFEYEEPNQSQGSVVIGDLICTGDMDFQITGQVRTSHYKRLRDWKGTFQIQFEFSVQSLTNLTRETDEKSYYDADFPRWSERGQKMVVSCREFLRFEDFNIEYCSCKPSWFGFGANSVAGSLKFTTNFYASYEQMEDRQGRLVALPPIDRLSTEFPTFNLNEIQHVEVTLDGTGMIKIKVNSEIKQLMDKRLERDVPIKVDPTYIKSFATIMNVKITE